MRGLKLGRAPNILSFLQIHLKSALMEEKKNNEEADGQRASEMNLTWTLRIVTRCVGYLLLYNKLPQNLQLKMTDVSCLIVSMCQELGVN